ncbi:phosphocholine-specific phospholipase C [Membranihabitans marinus]|uniref:phosphocholine-specific phospholipase C n=1 Tax=Membranihabitans marinus TaxID=1227546 RepID=UPI001F0220F1|nr:phospholipase C, phosphocholine-specific [Membranihabitans marinus]
MDTRREFLKKASLLSGGATMTPFLRSVIERALEIQPKQGSTFLDAEHIVVLMQENRSFDHAFGTMKGVRGYNDPRAIDLPNKNKVWLQTNNKGLTYAPFRLDIKETKSTWMSSLPHSWENMVDARNGGKYDKWLIAKKSGRDNYAHMPLTMGYYDRNDLPFYYALADAFTICDHNFCSSLTGTTANRHFLWTGILRDPIDPMSKANVHNGDVTYNRWASWKTFPERLEENGISWMIYQNEISMPVGFNDEESDWLANFTDNNMEWFSQYHVMFAEGFQDYLARLVDVLPETIKELEKDLQSISPLDERYGQILEKMEKTKKDLDQALQKRKEFSAEKFKQLPKREQNLHNKAFRTNKNDKDYHTITEFTYDDNGIERTMYLPKGDVLHQFRADVDNGELPEVSWLCAPQNFSDHPSAPWYGAWYISEVMDILTKNPEVWKKTIFIITYDENDGYFDHIPPFVPPSHDKENEGKMSASLDAKMEFAHLKDELKRHKGDMSRVRTGPVGLGFRVPMLVVSPWSKGGYVNSEVCDHTSVIQLIEQVLNHRTGKNIRETNISSWRRAICSDLTSAFRPYNGEEIPLPESTDREAFVQTIHRAQFRALPSNFKALSTEEIQDVNRNPLTSEHMTHQEPGIKNSNTLPYHLLVNGRYNALRDRFELTMKADDAILGNRAAGVPFALYAPDGYGLGPDEAITDVKVWNYAVAAGDTLKDSFYLSGFKEGEYFLKLYGPNGFYREYRGNAKDPQVVIDQGYEIKGRRKLQTTGNLSLAISNSQNIDLKFIIKDNVYGSSDVMVDLASKGSDKAVQEVILDLSKNYGWYDISISVEGYPQFQQRLAGRVEAEGSNKTDPYMGRMV